MAATHLLMVAVSQMVSLIPEGLPVALTIALSVGMQRLATQGAIVRKLSTIETLGSVSVVCSDKTGTLTQNAMTVTQLVLPDGSHFQISGTGYLPEGDFFLEGSRVCPSEKSDLLDLLEAAALCNDSQLLPSPPPAPTSSSHVQPTHWTPVGDPTEAALLCAAQKAGLHPDQLRQAWPRKAEIPFDGSTKIMATQHCHESGSIRSILKGAPEVLLPLCASARIHQIARPWTPAIQCTVSTAVQALTSEALRVLAVAETFSPLDLSAGSTQFQQHAVFLGLIGQMDPPREEAHAAVADCRSAGIRPVMITGDHVATGLAIARKLDIAREGDLAVDGSQLEAMPEQDLRSALPKIAVFARVHPAQKLRIVEAFQACGEVVAMTGDGVNDAPALARADVGVAMGLSGTEVAKSAASLVLTDDRFSTLIHAISQGRLVYANVQKLLLFLFATSADEAILLGLALTFDCPLPLAAVQILWINLVTEGALTVNLVLEEAEGTEMRHPPVARSAPLISAAMWRRMALMVPASVAATFGFFLWRLHSGAPFPLGQTETFTLLAACQWFNVLNCESAVKSVLRLGILRNRWLAGGLLLANLLQLAVIYLPPLNRAFHTVPIPGPDLLLIGAIASSVLWIEELRKKLASRVQRVPPTAPPESTPLNA